MTTWKNNLAKLWSWGKYTVVNMRTMTCEEGTSKKFSYVEFGEVVGISVDTYDSNVEYFEDMRYDDMQTYLENQNVTEE